MNLIDEKEKKFHDEWANSVNPSSVNVDAVGNACTLPETRYIIKKLGNIKGKKVLELGCGCGEASVYFAKQGAEVTASDVSPGMLELTCKVAKLHNVAINTMECSAEKVPSDDNNFDIIYAANVMHHVDMDLALKEVSRLLRLDGVFVCWDPVKYNPAINIYRKRAMNVRTEDEHPIDYAYTKKVKQEFGNIQIKGFWLLTCMIFVKYYFIDKIDPNKERYWKKIIDDSNKLEKIYTRLENVDRFLLKIIPPLKWWCWNMVVIAKKESN